MSASAQHRRAALYARGGVTSSGARLHFPEQVIEGKFDEDFPLFPNSKGGICSKESMAATFAEAAKYLGLPLNPSMAQKSSLGTPYG